MRHKSLSVIDSRHARGGNVKKNFKLLVAGVAFVAAVMLCGNTALAATTTVTADACKVRASASTSADVVCSVSHGTKLEVLGSTNASDGYTWYQVKDGNNTGYIRADLVDTPDGAVDSSSSDNSASEQTGGTSESSGDSTDTASESTGTNPSSVASAVVTADSVTVRSGASTSTSKAGTAKNGQQLTVSGEAMDSDGYTWYQVSFLDGTKEVSGYIRSDFLEVTEMYRDLEAEAAEEEVTEEPEPIAAPTVNNDYEVVYEPNSEGVEEWFLYDHIKGTKQSINNIYAVMQQSQENSDEDSSKVGTYKIIIIILAVIILALVVGIAILLFKNRDNYDYDIDEDEDEDYEEEDEVEEIDDSEDEEEDDDYYQPKRKFGLGRSKKPVKRSRRSFDLDEEEDDDEEEDTYRKPTRRSRRDDSEAWSTNGMLDIDDDMEFEFLDLDN